MLREMVSGAETGRLGRVVRGLRIEVGGKKTLRAQRTGI